MPVVDLPLDQLEIEPKWNVRSGSWQHNEDVETGNGFRSLVELIKANGQDTPVKVIRQSGKLPFRLVAGFRRCAAVKELGWPTVRAEICENLDERQARALNLRENVGRENVSPADLAWGIQELCRGTKMTDKEVAGLVGFSQGYVNRLRGIMAMVTPAVTRKWRESLVTITVDAMSGLIALPKDEQPDAFAQLVATSQAKRRGRKPSEWLVTLKKQARRQGELFGTLLKYHHIDDIMSSWADIARHTLRIPPVASAEDIDEIAGEMGAGFEEGSK
jgi:ParB/RepB/Spo0J family partition protein